MSTCSSANSSCRTWQWYAYLTSPLATVLTRPTAHYTHQRPTDVRRATTRIPTCLVRSACQCHRHHQSWQSLHAYHDLRKYSSTRNLSAFRDALPVARFYDWTLRRGVCQVPTTHGGRVGVLAVHRDRVRYVPSLVRSSAHTPRTKTRRTYALA